MLSWLGLPRIASLEKVAERETSAPRPRSSNQLLNPRRKPVDDRFIRPRIEEHGLPRGYVDAVGTVADAGGEAQLGIARRVERLLALVEEAADLGGVAGEFRGKEFAGFEAGEDVLGVAALGQDPPDDAGAGGFEVEDLAVVELFEACLLYTSPSPRDS